MDVLETLDSLQSAAEEDIKKKRFNVLKNYKTEDVYKTVKPQIYFCINEAAKAFELLDIKKFEPILGNILYLGLEDVFIKEIKNEKPL